MTDARTLQPDDRIAHYRIVAPLGAGGMGEVYLAQDRTLERQVALKILPPELVRSQERVRRFVQEAKSASSLNHPNIVTIYEIGEDRVQPSSGGAGEASEPVRYIAMELVAGKTLGAKIYEERTDLRTLLGYLAQAAEGIAKAHAAGIVHRDLKPGNIMVSDDGFAKVLDFGLAKLTEKQDTGAEMTSAPTEAGDRTQGGALLGTAGYMSPEQTLGKTVDQRSDIFSFGCMLYEAATRSRPFAADSLVDSMHKILHDKPKPVEELNPKAPAELRRLVRKCLAKNPDQRMQSMKDLALDLRELVLEFDTLSASASSGPSGGSGIAVPMAPARHWSSRGLVVTAAVGVFGIIGIAFGIYGLRSKGPGATGGETAGRPLEVASVATRGGISSVALAPDGRTLAYLGEAGGQSTLMVRQVSTGSEVRLIAKRAPLWGLSYAPNGEHLFYAEHEPAVGESSLYQIPALGGVPRRIAAGIDSKVGFAPDGRRVCFVRNSKARDENSIVIHDLDSGAEKILATVKVPLSFAGSPAWSPDGATIVAAVHTAENGVHGELVAIGVDDGTKAPFGTTGWEVDSTQWMPDGRGLLISAYRYGGGSFSVPVWSISYPGGDSRRITSDNNVYLGLSLSRDGTLFASARQSRVANLWTVPVAGGAKPRQLTFNSDSESSVGSVDVAGNDAVVFSKASRGHLQVYAIGADGEGLRQLTSGEGDVHVTKSLPGGGFVGVVFGSDRVQHIVRADADGGNLRHVTTGSGEWFGDVSPDGKTLLFSRVESPRDLWSVSLGGGEAVKVATDADAVVGFSPDGTKIAYATPPELEGQSLRTVLVVPASGGAPVAKFSLPADSGYYRWTHDGAALAFLSGGNVSNLFRQPLSGGAAQQLTRFTEGQIWSQEWMSGGTFVLLNRRLGEVSNLWGVAAGGPDPVALTDFVTGSIFDVRSTPDGKSVVFTYGIESQDAVLVKNFR